MLMQLASRQCRTALEMCVRRRSIGNCQGLRRLPVRWLWRQRPREMSRSSGARISQAVARWTSSRPPLVVRTLLVGTTAGLLTPFYVIFAGWRAIHHFTPSPLLRIAIFGSAGTLAAFLLVDCMPWLYTHAELLAPIAIANATVSSTMYLILDLILGGPRRLLQFGPVGALIGAGTGLLAPFLYAPITEWFFEVTIPPGIVEAVNGWLSRTLTFAVMVPVGALSGLVLHPLLAKVVMGLPGVAWPMVALPMLCGTLGLSIIVYFIEVVDSTVEYRVIDPALVSAVGLHSVYRVCARCPVTGDPVLGSTAIPTTHDMSTRLPLPVLDNGDAAKAGFVARARLKTAISDAKQENALLFSNQGQIRAQRGLDRLGEFLYGETISIPQYKSIFAGRMLAWDADALSEKLAHAQSVALRTDSIAVLCQDAYSKVEFDVNNRGLFVTDATVRADTILGTAQSSATSLACLLANVPKLADTDRLHRSETALALAEITNGADLGDLTIEAFAAIGVARYPDEYAAWADNSQTSWYESVEAQVLLEQANEKICRNALDDKLREEPYIHVGLADLKLAVGRRTEQKASLLNAAALTTLVTICLAAVSFTQWGSLM